jgi:hypothetical protein
MIVIEMRQAAKDKAFDLLDEIKDLGRKKKMAICELEETLYDCFESEEDEEREEDEDFETPEEDDEYDMDYRGRRGYRSGSRSAMRRAMREDSTDMRGMRMRMRYGMRRRNSMGRFV